jgi:hypothetical protein
MLGHIRPTGSRFCSEEAVWNINIGWFYSSDSWDTTSRVGNELFPDQFDVLTISSEFVDGKCAYGVTIGYMGTYSDLWTRLRLLTCLTVGEYGAAPIDLDMIHAFCDSTGADRESIQNPSDLWKYIRANLTIEHLRSA